MLVLNVSTICKRGSIGWNSTQTLSSASPPFVPSRAPLALYDEACAAYEDDAASRPHGKGKATEVDEDYMEEEDDEDDDGGDDGDHEDDDDYEDE